MKRLDEVYLARTWLEDVLLNTFKVPGGTLTIASTSKSEEINMKTHVITTVFSIMADQSKMIERNIFSLISVLSASWLSNEQPFDRSLIAYIN